MRVERARLAFRLGELDEAREVALQALDLLDGVGAAASDDVADAWRTLAEVLARVGESELAEQAFTSAVEALRDAPVKYLADTYKS